MTEFTNLRALIVQIINNDGLTQNQLAEIIGVKQPTISKILKGRQKCVSHMVYVKLINCLNGQHDKPPQSP
ncbi:XRE family transcriptional regulator [Desulfonatronovibrio hydrogenovorans]|uniref:XRE family transcriptional regulator n=1 Tax=Desulfonatronovibrio hydrogenovorans TaxID=53245 RepID=UPI0005549060